MLYEVDLYFKKASLDKDVFRRGKFSSMLSYVQVGNIQKEGQILGMWGQDH